MSQNESLAFSHFSSEHLRQNLRESPGGAEQERGGEEEDRVPVLPAERSALQQGATHTAVLTLKDEKLFS